MEKENRRIWRPVPCEPYDITTLQAWLEDMAQKGWQLTKDGFFMGLACFEEMPPSQVRYRLEGAMHNVSFFSARGENPDEEAVDLAHEFGWEYVARIGQFFIYAACDPEAREFNTDPHVQSITLNAVKRRMLEDVISTFLWLAVYSFLSIKGMVLQLMLDVGSVFVSVGIFLILYNTVRGVIRVVYLHRLRRKLLQEGMVAPNIQWRKQKTAYWVREIGILVLTIAWLCTGVGLWARDVGEETRHSIQKEPVDPPFATLSDMVPGEYETMFSGMGDSYEVKQDLLALEIWNWEEIAEIRTQTGEVFRANLYINYAEMRWEFLADGLAQSYLWENRFEKGYRKLTAPDLDADRVGMYTTHYLSGNCLILREGNQVIRARLYTADDLPVEVWGRYLAESLQNDA